VSPLFGGVFVGRKDPSILLGHVLVIVVKGICWTHVASSVLILGHAWHCKGRAIGFQHVQHVCRRLAAGERAIFSESASNLETFPKVNRPFDSKLTIGRFVPKRTLRPAGTLPEPNKPSRGDPAKGFLVFLRGMCGTIGSRRFFVGRRSATAPPRQAIEPIGSSVPMVAGGTSFSILWILTNFKHSSCR
jgi:hypothetical protein